MKYIFIALIRFYKKCISPLFPPKCKYYPTCSTYALEAFTRFGFFRGFALSSWRLLRCNPWSLGGIDYVPDKFSLRYRKIGKYMADSKGNTDVFEDDRENYDSRQ